MSIATLAVPILLQRKSQNKVKLVQGRKLEEDPNLIFAPMVTIGGAVQI